MLSILIPVFQHDCTALVQALYQQAEKLKIQYEIILAEDGSTQVADYSQLHIPALKHIVRKENVGRSAIRNFLFSQAQYPLLLMLDCDVTLPCDDFLQRYLEAAKDNSYQCFCGGNIFVNTSAENEKSLRWRFEKYHQKHITIERLNSNPHASFWSSNFLTRHFVVKPQETLQVLFDERFKGYGYEDVKFGKDLRRADYRIRYIDNPVLNENIDDDETYLRKIDESMHALYTFRKVLRSESGIVRTAEFLKKIHLAWLVKICNLSKLLPMPYSIQYYRLRKYLSF